MAIYFDTADPAGLLKAFRDAINKTEPAGRIETWVLDADGDVTHKADQWARKCWLRPVAEPGRLAFYTLAPKNQRLKVVVYGYYHGHLIETFLNHFDKSFSEASATALATSRDNIRG